MSELSRYRLAEGPHRTLHNAIWWAENRSADQAARWLDGFQAAIRLLSEKPEKHPAAPENSSFPERELRQMLYGLSGKPTHRAVFEIRADSVFVHTVRHLAQQYLTPEDID